MNRNSSGRTRDLDALVALTEHMLSKARSAEWDEVPAMERQRREWLESALADAVAPEEAAAVSARLQRILDLDKELLALSGASRDESAAQLNQLRQGERARNAYAGAKAP